MQNPAGAVNVVPAWLSQWYPLFVSTVFAVLGMLLKLIARRNSDTSPKRNDCYIGTTLISGSLAAVATSIIRAILGSRPDAAISWLFWALALAVLLLVTVFFDRFFGWEERNNVYYRSWVSLYVLNPLGTIAFLLTFKFAEKLKV